MLQDTYRGPGLTCSVMLSLEKRRLVERRFVARQAWLWYLTAEGEQVARVCRMKVQLSQKGPMDDGRSPSPDW